MRQPHAIAVVRLRTPRHDPRAKRRRFIWLVLARVLHEQGDLDAVVDVELVEQAGDGGLDRGGGGGQRRGGLRGCVGAARGGGGNPPPGGGGGPRGGGGGGGGARGR